jgi:hypothetical protein
VLDADLRVLAQLIELQAHVRRVRALARLRGARGHQRNVTQLEPPQLPPHRHGAAADHDPVEGEARVGLAPDDEGIEAVGVAIGEA